MGPGLVVSMRTTWGPGLVGLIDAQHLEGGEHGGACRVLTYLLLTYLLTWKAASTAEPVEYLLTYLLLTTYLLTYLEGGEHGGACRVLQRALVNLLAGDGGAPLAGRALSSAMAGPCPTVRVLTYYLLLTTYYLLLTYLPAMAGPCPTES